MISSSTTPGTTRSVVQKKQCFNHHLLQGQRCVASLLAGAQCLVQCHRSCHQPGCARARLRRGHQVRRRPSPNRRSLVSRALCPAPPHHHALPQDQVGIFPLSLDDVSKINFCRWICRISIEYSTESSLFHQNRKSFDLNCVLFIML